MEVDLKAILGIDERRKTICALMGSDDENVAFETVGAWSLDSNLLFPKQVDWIRALIDFVVNRQDLNLIVRVHPREFPNKREGVLSEHAQMLKSVLTGLPSNVRVNWPTDNISLYDLAGIVDVFANSWSSAGKEMAMLGIPVVLYSHSLVSYPSELNYVGNTQKEYFRQLEQALKDGWSPEWIRKSYRWCGMEYGYSLLDISESFSRSENRSTLAKVISKLMRGIAPYREQESDCRDRALRLSCSGMINLVLSDQLTSILDIDEHDVTVSHSEETGSIKREVRRLVEALYGAKDGYHRNSLANKLHNFANS